jgi:hypothetical protein
MLLTCVRRPRPFGAPAEDVFKSDVAVLVGAGIGVTVRRRRVVDNGQRRKY